jgi:O-antigen/teichoic acid export membrane protein
MVFFVGVFNVYECLYNSQIRGKIIALSKIIAVTISSAGKVICLLLGFGINSVLWFSVFEIALIGLVFLLGKPGLDIKFVGGRDRNYRSFLFRNSWPLLLSAGAIVLYQRVDILMLKSMANLEQVGQYAVGLKFFTLINLIPVSLVAALSPSLYKCKKDQPALYDERAQLLMDLCFWSTLIPSIVFLVAAPFVVPLFFGSAYLPAVYLSQIIIWRSVFSGMGLSSGQWILSEGLQHMAMFRTFGGLVVNILLNYLWIGRYGAVGASYATLISFFIANCLLHLFVPRLRPLWFMQWRALIYGPVNLYRHFRNLLLVRNHV